MFLTPASWLWRTDILHRGHIFVTSSHFERPSSDLLKITQIEALGPLVGYRAHFDFRYPLLPVKAPITHSDGRFKAGLKDPEKLSNSRHVHRKLGDYDSGFFRSDRHSYLGLSKGILVGRNPNLHLDIQSSFICKVGQPYFKTQSGMPPGISPRCVGKTDS